MNTTHTALIVPPRLGEPLRVVPVAGPESLKDLLGGDFESVARGDWHLYLNAEGTSANLPVNLRADQLMHDCGLDLAGAARGPAVIVGRDAKGKDTSIPEHLLRLAAELFGTPQAAA
ncbi:DUF3846 domain-containing protein [Arthrobacter globiformis]|uniref:DUF3846 domain-containing protein n=1 Tax=Arthrobacter globiformis TaxID=1665 RepID=UPI00278384AA|nr:hypothetical protein [Arthrobacter globiformis]MDQ0862788.1 hypothetical protein [Arthrobacter globiformis]